MTNRGFNSLPTGSAVTGFSLLSLRMGAAIAKSIHRLGRAVIAVFDAVGEARQRAYERRMLAEMDLRMCRDIGVSPRASPFDQVDPAVHDYRRGR